LGKILTKPIQKKRRLGRKQDQILGTSTLSLKAEHIMAKVIRGKRDVTFEKSGTLPFRISDLPVGPISIAPH